MDAAAIQQFLQQAMGGQQSAQPGMQQPMDPMQEQARRLALAQMAQQGQPQVGVPGQQDPNQPPPGQVPVGQPAPEPPWWRQLLQAAQQGQPPVGLSDQHPTGAAVNARQAELERVARETQ